MFCHKCGAKIADGAAFCHKCGAKVVYTDTIQKSVDDTAPTIEAQDETTQQIPTVSIQAITALNSKTNFKMFVNNHIQATTSYQSAEEVLNSHVQQRFVWMCFGIPTILRPLKSLCNRRKMTV